IGKANDVTFRTTGKEIIEKGWKVVFEKQNENSERQKAEDRSLPSFIKGEKGTHEPSFLEKETKAPKYYTEATLLRAMETAGKQIDDDDLRDLMKENGIGRPSTRANIIETLFRRKYVVRKKKQLLPTDTGIKLIDTIQNKLLKSAELTGRWEKQLKEIEKGTFNAGTFIKNMKKMVDQLVYEVRSEKIRANISSQNNVVKKQETRSKKQEKKKGVTQQTCPKCKKGSLLKGTSAYGCSNYKNGCDFRLPFIFMGKKISDNQFIRLIQKGATVNLKGFKSDNGKIDGIVVFDSDFNLNLNIKKEATNNKQATQACPKCKKGTIIKGKTAYGCSAYKSGCDFRFSFDEIRQKANSEKLTKDLVLKIISSQQ
ncbi:MAG TPA: type IA DNA topoisomerase, partial [Flavobacteriaceae bacterium]|nr:type IA DNA topoisomerase [Flavobacteriaceae bacterium]